MERVVGVVMDALEIVGPIIPEEESREFVAARLRELAATIESEQ
ncbi:MAG: hypothetical protein WAQ33_01820 [Gaiellaceae bacterium]